MKTARSYLLVLFAFFAGRLEAQLSPGELAKSHKGLEGIGNCTKCHDLGNKVTNDKCLSCHTEIKQLIGRNEGYHVSAEVKGKDCAKCHSDHHGRNFNMVRYDQKNFNHNLAGYELTGAHKRVDCRECHKPDNIEDANLKKRPNTFLGLGTNCAVCHKDVHQKTLGNNCAKCHNTEKFVPAASFNHDKTDFPLAGKHKTVQCIDCHQKETRAGQPFQRFSDVPFKNCNSCHKDPHDDNLGTNCKECHSEQSFAGTAGLGRFNHGKTHFPLKGKHRPLECRECHNMLSPPLTIFQDRLGIQTQNCNACHKDVHENKFGTNCAECHTEDGFRKVGNMDNFNHNRTSFALEGKHETVDCKKCHKSEHMTDPLPHNTCAACHSDYHEGQFAGLVLRPDCAECHSVNGFDESTYSLERHAKTKFPLEGAHVATPCFACHKQEEKWEFKGLGLRCADCHKDVHNGQIAEKWYPGKTCEQCHSTASWQENHFDHSKAAFVLKGVHKETACRECHKPEPGFQYGKFAGLPAGCENCHADTHNRQFQMEGVTDCNKCHSFANWKIPKFNHDKTAFKLEGKHAKVACADCHKAITEGEVTFIQYKFPKLECAICHY